MILKKESKYLRRLMNNDKRVPDGRWKDFIDDPGFTQGDCCNLARCEDTYIDCGDCMFSEFFCDRETYDEWRDKYLKENG